jgi:hypothetical protein
VAWKFYEEIAEEDAIDDDASVDASDDGQEDPPDPPAAACIDPGDTGGDDSGEKGVIGPFAMVQCSRIDNRSNKNEASRD